VIAALLDAVPGLTVLHQSGVRNGEATQAAYEASGADRARWQVMPFINDMPEQFAQAHLVMARSGASTVAELAAAGKPALLVPFAAAADQHQRRNAEVMVDAGAAVMLQESELEQPGKLLGTLAGLLSSPGRLIAMGEAARKQAHPRAAERIAEKLVELAGERS
jgi:UDP-N-acetylglucosamine--N-acetylmuramyl-(pentapeptide) pyrophosphoryl-undecaprenol N-acetylglucosamine transferase